MTRRTQVQLVLVISGLIVWGYGQRVDDGNIRWAGIGCFAIATILRFTKRRDPPTE